MTTLDPGDFDSFGVAADLIVALRRHGIDGDVIASLSAPPGRHRLHITARPSGHMVLSVRYDDLTLSRRNVLADALATRGWDTDEDQQGATRRFPPGTEHTTVVFEVLEVLTLGGTPPDPRTVSVVDASGLPVALD